jgi:hypothetical protein
VDAAAGLVVETVTQSCFKPTTYSVERLEALELSSRVKGALLDLYPGVRVHAHAGNVEIRFTPRGLLRKRRIRTARRRVAQIEGVKDVKFQVVEDAFDRILGGSRVR